MRYLKQSTATVIEVGPFIDDTDGKTLEEALTVASIDVQLMQPLDTAAVPPDLVSNGAFGSDTVWTKNSWTIAGGVADSAAAQDTNLDQTISITENKAYELVFDVATQSAGSVLPILGTTSGTSRSTVSTFTETIIAGSGSLIRFDAVGFTGTIDNVVIKQVPIPITPAASGSTNDMVLCQANTGTYWLELTANQVGIVGRHKLTAFISGALIVWEEFMVLPANVYDSMVLGTDNLQTDAIQISGDATAADNAELFFDGTGYAGGTTKLDVNIASSDNIALTAQQKLDVNTEADTALAGYDAVTRTEATSDKDSIETNIAALNDVSTAQVNTEVDNAIVTYGLDHLVQAAVIGADVADNSIIAKLVDDAATADWDGYDPTTASLEALNVDTDAIKSETALIVADTNELQLDDTPGAIAALPTAVENRTEMDSNSTQLTAIVADTNELQTDNTPGAIAALNNITAASVWGVDATGEQNAGTFGLAIGDPAASAETIWKSLHTDAAGDAISDDIKAIKAETVLIVADTNELQVDNVPGLIAALPTAVENRSEMDSNSTRLSAIEGDTDVIDDGTSGLVKIAQDVAAILVDTGTTLPTTLQGIVLAQGTIGATGNDTTHLHLSGLAYADDGINEHLIVLKDVSTGLWYSTWISDFVNSTDLATVNTLPITPEASVDLYWLLPMRQDLTGGSGPNAATIADAVWDEQKAGHVAANSFGKMNADIETDADTTVTELANGTDGLSALKTLIDTVNSDLANGTDGLGALKVLIDTVNTDLSNGTDGLGALKTLIDALNDPTIAAIVDAVWDEDVDVTHQTAGSAGKKLDDAGAAADPWATALPGAYGAGTAGKIIGDNINAPIATVDTVVDGIQTDLSNGTDGLGALKILIDALNDLSAAQVNAEVVDALDTDTYAELGAVPAATSSITDKLNWLFALARNKVTQTTTTQTLRNDADAGNIATAAVSNDGTTATRGEFS